MSYRGGRPRGEGENFSVTSNRNGSRTFFGEHDDRWDNNNSSSSSFSRGGRGGYRGNRGGGTRGNWDSRGRGNRGGGGTRYKHFNSRGSKFRYSRPERGGTDEDGDVSMSGDSFGRRSRGARGTYSNRSRSNYGRSSYRGRGGASVADCRWFRVMVPYGTKLTKDQLFTMITSNFSGDFNPIKYTRENTSQRVSFYVEDGNVAESLRSLSRRVTKPDGHKLILHVNPAPDFHHVDQNTIEKLKFRMSDRYDPATQTLNLSSLYTDEALNKDNLYIALNKMDNMDAVTSIIKEHIPELTGLDVSKNRIVSLGHMKTLAKATPGMKYLNLGHNHLHNVDELCKLSWTNISELVLEGNHDLVNNYNNQTAYLSAVRKYFPKVVKLDGHDYPPPVTFDISNDLQLPPSKDCQFINDEIKSLVVSFIKEYFTIYDTDKRRDLIPAYHEHAQFSLCINKCPVGDRQQTGFSYYLDDSRNLKRIGHLHSDKLVKKTKFGVLEIASMLEHLPKVTHDLTSFKVDVSLASPTMLSFVVHGMFKESTMRDDKSAIRCFSRSFITVPSGPGMVITNDMLTISNAGYDQAKRAFREEAPTPSSSPASGSQANVDVASPSVSYSPEQIDMVNRFCVDSGMNADFSRKCLEENGWDYQRAGEVFTNLNAQGKIPPDAFIKSEMGL